MRNDLIVFEFQNDGAREVLIQPQLITQLGDLLNEAFWEAQRLAANESDIATHPLKIWLTAIERGSLKVAFRALFHPNNTKDLKEALEATNLALDSLFKIGKIFGGAALILGAFSIWSAPSDGNEKPEISREQAEHFRHYTDQMLAIGYASGADRVLVMMPDQPTMIMTLDPQLHMAALGSEAMPIDQGLFGREIEGILETGSNRLKVRIPDNQEAELMSGRFRVDGAVFPVVFRWNSSRPLPSSGVSVTVRGWLSNIRSAGIQPLNPVTDDLRSVGTFLDVKKQVVAE